MRVLAINDVSCIGKCSLTVAQPIISACGVTCNVLPTALLSTHTGGFTGYTFLDLTSEIPPILAHWKSLGIRFDIIYSGYLGSIEQIDLVLFIIREFLAENGKVVVDPVMGDSGTLYSGFSEKFVEEMRLLCGRADFILPNATEACYLSGVPYPLTSDTAKVALQKLQTLCPNPVITGVDDEKGVSLYFASAQGAQVYTHKNVTGFFCGAGDVFASAFVGCLARGKNFEDAITLSADFVSASISRSASEVEDKRYGLNFEKEIYSFLQKLNA